MIRNTEEERFQKFLKGTFLIKGWNARASEILQAVAAKERNEIKEILSRLGEKIGREWSRDSGARRIDTPMLQQWGMELQNAKEAGPGPLASRLRELDREVDRILS